ncbi:MAG: TadE/TadG family type IV pilus assembly protein [Chloroflexota bacterium]|nr:TadE/TadG family type IV pilus assembly protein [Chloroflexota bacterium]
MAEERGSSLIEFALVLPLLLLLIIGLLQAGFWGYASLIAGEAARHGARVGSVAQANPSGYAQQAALDEAQAAFPAAAPEVQILAPGGVVGSDLTLEVKFNVPNLLWHAGLGALFPLPAANHPTLAVRRQVTFRQEGW